MNGTGAIPEVVAVPGYGESYRAWKGWGSTIPFGSLTETQADYFRREIAALGGVSISRVLDIGFGNGEFMQYCRSRGWQVSGTEIDAGLVEMARQAGFDAHAAEALDGLPEKSYDLVVAFDVLEHISQAELPSFLRQMAARLAPAGLLLCKFPNGDSPFGRPFQNGDVTHLTTLGEAKIRRLAGLAGLQVMRLAGEARPDVDRSWRMVVSRFVVRVLELTLEPCIKNVMFPGWKFALFSPNTVVAMRAKS